jgi:sulfide:quinone oxidoreductase
MFSPGFKVVIVGGGVAALEAALALREFGGDRIATTILAPDEEFVYRPMAVREPFGLAQAKRYPLTRIARDAGAELCSDQFTWLEHERRVVHTAAGAELRYDAAILAMGAHVYPRFGHSITLDPSRLDEQLHGLVQDIDGGYIHRLAFIIPAASAWPLPIYELALMTSARAGECYADVSITIVTPEGAPLAIFGPEVSDRVGELLTQSGIVLIPSSHCEVLEPGRVGIHPGPRELLVDRIISLPQLFGPSAAGVPADAAGGFISVDDHCRVRGLDGVYAAGDATDFPIKFGGIAAQQADLAAQSIAALAGVAPEPGPFSPDLHAVLLTGDRPLLLSARVGGRTGAHSRIAEAPDWSPPAKIVAGYLAPYLHELDRAATASV